MEEKNMIRCLICDDHEALRYGLVASLEAAEGIEVVGQAADAETTIALLERRRPHVAVIDVHLSGRGGIEICRELSERGSDVAVLLYTADADPATVHAALGAGAKGFVLKRGPLREVVRAVELLASGQSYVDSTVVTSLLEHRTEEQRSLLSERETQVLQLLGDGMTTEAAASELFLSPATVRSYIETAMRKLDTRSRTHAVAMALRESLIQ